MEEDWKHPKPGHEHLGRISEAVAAETDWGEDSVNSFPLEQQGIETWAECVHQYKAFQPTTTYLAVKLDRTLFYRQHLARLRAKVMARSALIRKLVGTGWGASSSILRTSALALVYAPAEYCAPTWSRSRHTSLLDVSLNYTLRIITGCLQPTPIEQIPVRTAIPPAELRRQAASLTLARRAMDPDHLLHHTITREETQPRLISRRPFNTSGKDFLSTALPNETKAQWIARMWSRRWQPSTSRLPEYIVSPSKCCPGSDLPRQITSSPSAPFIVHQMVFMAWLMLMQMQQLVSGSPYGESGLFILWGWGRQWSQLSYFPGQ